MANEPFQRERFATWLHESPSGFGRIFLKQKAALFLGFIFWRISSRFARELVFNWSGWISSQHDSPERGQLSFWDEFLYLEPQGQAFYKWMEMVKQPFFM